MHAPSRTATVARSRRLKNVALLAVAVLAMAAVAIASAKEITSGGGGGGGGITACNPVSSLKAKGDARAGETGLATIDVSYSVKPCDNGQTVSVHVSVYESLNRAQVVWDDPAAAQSQSFTVFGVKTRTSYIVKVDVIDVATGLSAGAQSISVAAIPKGV